MWIKRHEELIRSWRELMEKWLNEFTHQMSRRLARSGAASEG